VLDRMQTGYGRDGDVGLMHDMGTNILFRAFCALADGTAAVINSSLEHFRDEFEEHVRLGRCPFEDVAAEVAS
jgi:NADH-quinone oxidoreductase subunit F